MDACVPSVHDVHMQWKVPINSAAFFCFRDGLGDLGVVSRWPIYHVLGACLPEVPLMWARFHWRSLHQFC